MNNTPFHKYTQVQWLWLDIGHNQIVQHIIEWGDNPVINLADSHFYSYFNMRYLGRRPFQYLQTKDNHSFSISSTTPMSEIIRWAKAGRSGAGASDAVTMSDIGAYFKAVIFPIIRSQSGIDSAILSQHDTCDHIVIAPMLDTNSVNIPFGLYIDNPNTIIPTLFMVVINLSPILSRYWLQNTDLLCQTKNMLLDILPGIERSQIYASDNTPMHNIKDCLTTAEFNLATAIWSHFAYSRGGIYKNENISIPVSCNNGQIINVNANLDTIFDRVSTYFPSFIVVWTNFNCHDIIESNDIPIDATISIDKRTDKKKSNESMLAKNSTLAKMLYLNMRTRGELKRNEIIRSPLLATLHKSRDKARRAAYRKHCGSSSYHYITNTNKYRTSVITSDSKSQNIRQTMLSNATEHVEQLSQQLSNITI